MSTGTFSKGGSTAKLSYPLTINLLPSLVAQLFRPSGSWCRSLTTISVRLSRRALDPLGGKRYRLATSRSWYSLYRPRKNEKLSWLSEKRRSYNRSKFGRAWNRTWGIVEGSQRSYISIIIILKLPRNLYAVVLLVYDEPKLLFYLPFFQLKDQFVQNDNLDAYCISMRWIRSWEMFVKGNKDG